VARFLLLAKDIGRKGRQEGDPVGVFDDAHIFGQREDKSVWLANGNAEVDWPGTFSVVDILGMPLDEAQRIMQRHVRPAVDGEIEFEESDRSDRVVDLGRHRWKLDVETKLSSSDRDKIRLDGALDITYDTTTVNNVMTDRSGFDDFIPTDGKIDPIPPSR